MCPTCDSEGPCGCCTCSWLVGDTGFHARVSALDCPVHDPGPKPQQPVGWMFSPKPV